ncbi:MAG: TIGR03790 family protein [Pirellulales bacterium]|nr:TIGR03790 family protein [Pirellulales bacterium]
MKQLVFSVAILCLASGSVRTAKADLTPDQVVIIAMAKSEESRSLAEYYAKARGIPESHILLLEGRPTQRISRYQWEHTFRPSILKWLKRQEFYTRTRCFVTVWDVPLEITPLGGSSLEITERVAHLREVRANLVDQIATLFRMLHSVGKQPGAAVPAPVLAGDISFQDLYTHFKNAMKPADAWLRNTKPGDDRKRATQFMERVLVTLSGNQGLIRLAKNRSQSTRNSPEEMTRLAYVTGRIEGLQQGMKSLSLLRDTIARDDQMIDLTQAMGGLFGSIRWIDQQLYLLKQNFTAASFDSELSLILWPDPPILSWLPNPWHYKFDVMPTRRRTTMLVSRLSAPSPEIVRRMIDDTIAAEKTSLQGNVYLDARALAYDPKEPSNDSFARYDQSLRDLAARLKRHTSLNVVLDDQPALFQRDRCPDAALYCGWHSPNDYVDAFRWSPGAVGYHLAMSEASWLQLNDDDRVQGRNPWCQAMLSDGAVATLGSSREAYLAAFPLPDDFFSLLLTGKYSLAEVYSRTCPFLSWTVLLIGDPLYNPYKNQPQLSEAALPEQMKPGGAREVHADSSSAEQPDSEPTQDTAPGEEEPAPSDEPTIVLPGLDP